MIIHFHFHFKTTGVTRSVESVLGPLDLLEETRIFGYGILTHKISFFKLLKELYSKEKTIVHTHRNNETLFALALRFFGAKFKLFTTRHAESKPSSTTNYLMSKADQCISLSQNMAQNLPIETKTIGHGVDTEWFHYNSKKRVPNQKKISVVGRIRKAKGQRDVMEAIAPILSQNPNWIIQFIGTIDRPTYAEEIKSIASISDVEKQIHFISQTNKIEEYYQASSVVIIASYTEGFSLVCLEAMASGCTTIATEKVGIHSDVIEHGTNGFLFPKGSVSTLREVLKKVIEQAQDLDPEKVRKTILDNWSVTSAAQKLFETYTTYRNIC